MAINNISYSYFSIHHVILTIKHYFNRHIKKIIKGSTELQNKENETAFTHYIFKTIISLLVRDGSSI